MNRYWSCLPDGEGLKRRISFNEDGLSWTRPRDHIDDERYPQSQVDVVSFAGRLVLDGVALPSANLGTNVEDWPEPRAHGYWTLDLNIKAREERNAASYARTGKAASKPKDEKPRAPYQSKRIDPRLFIPAEMHVKTVLGNQGITLEWKPVDGIEHTGD